MKPTLPSISRRSVLKGAAALSAISAIPALSAASKFKIGVISDEISQDFDHACSVIANDFGLHYVEIRELWKKNLQALNDTELAEAQKILAKYKLQVTDIASPLFKVDWPDAPKTKFSTEGDMHGASASTLQKQDQVLEHSIALAKRFKTNKVRCFDFWRIDNVAPYRAAINEKLRSSAEVSGRQGIMLVIENEFACNTGTGREAAATLAGVKNPHFALNWDPGNAVRAGELDAYPNGWNAIPKSRIHHCHVKNAVKNASGGYEWSPVDKGYVDWPAQFRALKSIGYSEAVSLETHWRGAGTPEASTRISWNGMKKSLEAAKAI